MDIAFNRPTLPPYTSLSRSVESFYSTGLVTNGPVVKQLEVAVREAFRVEHAIGISCCTSGLMLALKCLGLRGKVAMPSFTFFASAHAVVWNGLEPVFVDVEPDTWNISADSLRVALDGDDGISAVLPVHVFGNPCDVDALGALARERGLSVVYDAAHAMGAAVEERMVGTFGAAEVFSLSPTKLVVAGGGGVVTTADGNLAEALMSGRDYGNNGDYDPSFAGLNARMSEFHAALAVESFRMLEENVIRRNAIACRYVEGLYGLPGVTPQAIREGNRSTFKDFTVRIEANEFGMSRDALSWHLARNGIDSRRYYDPPVHRTKAYRERWGRYYDESLHETNRLSRQALSLPIWSHMEMGLVDRVVDAIAGARDKAEEIAREYLETAP